MCFQVTLRLPPALHDKYGAPLSARVNVTVTRSTGRPHPPHANGTSADSAGVDGTSADGAGGGGHGAGVNGGTGTGGGAAGGGTVGGSGGGGVVSGLDVLFDLVLVNKSATRLPESMFFSFDVTAPHGKSGTPQTWLSTACR